MRWLSLACLTVTLGLVTACSQETISLEQYCLDTGTAYCSRVTSCGVVATDCMTAFESGCCPGGVCPGTVDTSRADACVSDLATEACVDVQTGVVPVRCRP